ncbi:hypothetical protein B566_EDAN005048 [Ephemera danica]|nr:hypothetical protein B566_EDAN005048 [Ephemera danica]
MNWLRGLECSCDNLPTCLVLVEKNETTGALAVIGHSKISRVPSIELSGFIESVVIHRALRGKGLGRKLMLETEKYMKSIGLKTSYLSTYDQQNFYKKLGYDFCERVSIYGTSIPTFSKLKQLQDATESRTTNRRSQSSSENSESSTIPPPPPLPTAIVQPPELLCPPPTNNNLGKPKKDFMKKDLH